ncbi:hypothetical protein, variant [Saprolegnia diclina VS20]|uniref:Selenoprotein T n=1 Tax=Saprolegnia diclina (strain VS20) TaxID=1156394 RepID=T0Q7P2_SAPDV|nr:hypothetical protein, variant [Saprolegnia diclina VS20]EQC33894.1 hypothetical protein, variant [Saprolegnia diclina VS20]|eukprot:XP_008612689.1 hypothetical protein, variant [Saprolegnia diclina VS20]
MASVYRWLLALAFVAVALAPATSADVAKAPSFADDHVVVEYCVSCGYANNFKEVQTYLETHYPHLIGRVTGGNASPPAWKYYLGTIVGYAQAVGFIFLLAGEHILSALNLPADMPLFVQTRDNKFAVFAGLMLLSSISQSMSATGAFEVYLNGTLVFSKIRMGRWPNMQELVQALEAHGLQRH